MSKEKKNLQLGMNHGTASNRLKKNIMFSLIQRCELDVCHQCGEKIEDVSDLSVEHKIPWLDSEDPVGLFFDLNNISFSHLKCNIGAARKPNRTSAEEKRQKWRDNKRKHYTAESRREKYLRTGH